jgi:hypothetical protein
MKSKWHILTDICWQICMCWYSLTVVDIVWSILIYSDIVCQNISKLIKRYQQLSNYINTYIFVNIYLSRYVTCFSYMLHTIWAIELHQNNEVRRSRVSVLTIKHITETRVVLACRACRASRQAKPGPWLSQKMRTCVIVGWEHYTKILWQDSHPMTRLASWDKTCILWQDMHPTTRLASYDKTCILRRDLHPKTRLASYDKTCIPWQDFMLEIYSLYKCVVCIKNLQTYDFLKPTKCR